MADAPVRVNDVPQRHQKRRVLLADRIGDRLLLFPPLSHVPYQDAAHRLVGGGPGSEGRLAHHAIAQRHAVTNVAVKRQLTEVGGVFEIMLIFFRRHGGPIGFFVVSVLALVGFALVRGLIGLGIVLGLTALASFHDGREIERHPRRFGDAHLAAGRLVFHHEFPWHLIGKPVDDLDVRAGEEAAIAGLNVRHDDNFLGERGQRHRPGETHGQDDDKTTQQQGASHGSRLRSVWMRRSKK